MRYWWRRALNIATLSLLFKRYSRHYCISCKKHFPFGGIGKLVSIDHAVKRVKHQGHTVRVLGKLRGKPKTYRTLSVWKPPANLAIPDEFSLQDFCEATGDQGNEGCYDQETEVLTAEGWKFFNDSTLEDQIATRAPDGTIEYHHPIHKFDREYEGPMFHYSQRGLDFNVTPNHMIYARKWNEVERTLGDPIFVRADQTGWYMGAFRTGNWIGKDKEVFEIEHEHNRVHPTITHSIPMDDWLWFLGIYIAEGCTVKSDSDYRIEIAAVNSRKRPEIEGHLRRLPWKVSVLNDRFKIYNKRLYETLVPLGQAKEKHVPDYLRALPPHRIEKFLEGFVLGDGCELHGRTWLYTSSKRLADDLQELLLKTGRCGNIRKRSRLGGIFKGRQIRSSTAYEIEIKQRDIADLIPKNFDIEPYKGHVYCFEVPNHTMYVRRNGTPFWCGNSCTGWGWRGSYTVGTKLRKGKYPNKGWSARCAYNGARKLENRLQDEGAYCADVAKFANMNGHCTEAVWPYKAWEDGSRHWDDDPTIVVHPDDLKKGQTAGWRTVSSIDDIFAAIAAYNDVYIGIDWYDNWMNVVGSNMPAAQGSPVGGHSIHILAYNKKTGRVRIQNSWTTLWGSGGYADMLITDLKKVFGNGEFLVINFSTPPDPQPGPNPDPDDWLDKLQKLFEAFMKALTDLFGSAPVPKKRKAEY